MGGDRPDAEMVPTIRDIGKWASIRPRKFTARLRAYILSTAQIITLRNYLIDRCQVG